jgi:hypothetical protein
MIGENTPIADLPIGTTAFSILIGVLIVTYMITSVAALFYEQRSIYFGNNTTIPRGVKYLSCLVTVFMGFCQIYGAIFDFLSGGELWVLLLMRQILFGVISPILIISTSSQLKNYVKGTFQPFTSFVSVFFEQCCSRRSPQVIRWKNKQILSNTMLIKNSSIKLCD